LRDAALELNPHGVDALALKIARPKRSDFMWVARARHNEQQRDPSYQRQSIIGSGALLKREERSLLHGPPWANVGFCKREFAPDEAIAM
jgi:hypothetical protein